MNTPERRPVSKRFYATTAALLAVIFALSSCQVNPTLIPLESELATISVVSGQVETSPAGQENYSRVAGSAPLLTGELIKVMAQSRGQIALLDGSLVRLGEGSLISVKSIAQKPSGLSSWFKLGAGHVWILLKGESITVETPAGVAMLNGFLMEVEVTASGDVRVDCFQGQCNLNTTAGVLQLESGQSGSMSAGKLPPVMGSSDNVNADMGEPDWQIIPAVTRTALALAIPAEQTRIVETQAALSKTMTSTPAFTRTPTPGK